MGRPVPGTHAHAHPASSWLQSEAETQELTFLKLLVHGPHFENQWAKETVADERLSQENKISEFNPKIYSVLNVY